MSCAAESVVADEGVDSGVTDDEAVPLEAAAAAVGVPSVASSSVRVMSPKLRRRKLEKVVRVGSSLTPHRH